ncbi:hypothetical protein J2Z60_001576 [Lactobacillus colini]|uniref:Uncharacterized protein n=1 Tax=Lactobacillus colini TaxID=1819254 RepID=A0ABS4MGC1_9LACO|nr:hypothetical protein [Lactobacillus colini]MBP2058397.1 hypothetical protein [Lactobacillus colini]
MKTKEDFNIYCIEINEMKSSPVLVLEDDGLNVYFYKFITDYFNKTLRTKQQCHLVKDRKGASLKQLFWIDLGVIYKMPKEHIKLSLLGSLSSTDQLKLIKFKHELNRYR